ncbi:hypothetical protein [Flavobacterium sp. '19STA2R22 D10 B1']|uniref:hypothetical protein n=1 Tax=Flavobacterium aerium TaxID=3037261 RepID=UPI00278C8ED7|nr:hypothetical protein [Flavobacterium sp. '19STA2R22 D10 B1']
MKNSILKIEGVSELSKETLLTITGGAGCGPGEVRFECDGPWIWVPNVCAVDLPFCEDPF